MGNQCKGEPINSESIDKVIERINSLVNSIENVAEKFTKELSEKIEKINNDITLTVEEKLKKIKELEEKLLKELEETKAKIQKAIEDAVESIVKELEGIKCDIEIQISKIAPIVALLTLPKGDIGAIISWISTLKNNILAPTVKPLVTHAAQIATLATKATELASAVSGATSALSSLSLTPSLPNVPSFDLADFDENTRNILESITDAELESGNYDTTRPPENPVIGDLWLDAEGNAYQWDGTEWIQINLEDFLSGKLTLIKTTSVYLYQWSSALPTKPTGNSTYFWDTKLNTEYDGYDDWFTNLPSNIGTPGVYLWVAKADISTAYVSNTSVVDYETAVIERVSFTTKISGLHNVLQSIYKWDITIPELSGVTSTYNWTTEEFDVLPSGWSKIAPVAPSQGYTLWSANINIIDVSTAVTTNVSWVTASIGAIGYAGVDGIQGNSVDFIFKKSIEQPTTPDISEATPEGWVSNIANIGEGEGYIWSCVGYFNTSTGIYVWETPIRIEGSEGLIYFEATIYKRSETSISTTPTGGSYNFNTKELIAPEGWSTGIPDGSFPVYISKATASGNSVVPLDDSLSWSSPLVAYTDPVVVQLSNDSQGIVTDIYGENGYYNDAVSSIKVYQGGTDVTSLWDIVTVASEGIERLENETDSSKTFTVVEMATDNGYVDFFATKSGYANFTKRFNLYKIRGSATASSYKIITSPSTIRKDVGNVLYPNSINATSTKTSGNISNSYSGIFKVFEDDVLKYTSPSNEISLDYTPSTSDLSSVKFGIYPDSSLTNYIKYSEDLNNEEWDKYNTPLVNPVSDSSFSVEDNSNTIVEYIYQYINVNGGSNYTISCDILKDKIKRTERFVKLRNEFFNSSSINIGFVSIKIDTKTGEYHVESNISPSPVSNVDIDGDFNKLYWNVSFTVLTPSTTTKCKVDFIPSSGASENWIDSSSVLGSAIFRHPQFNLGSSKTEYVKTDYGISSLDEQSVSILEDGLTAPIFTITNSNVVFKKDQAGTISPSSVVLSTAVSNVVSPTYQWKKNGTVISGATASTYTVATADYASNVTNTYSCTVTGTINGIANQTLSDAITIPLLVDSKSNVNVVLSNENITFAAPLSGYTGISFTNGSCVITAYQGTTSLTYGTTGANTFSIGTLTKSGVTVTNTSGTINAPTAMSSNNAYVDVPITIRDASNTATTITKRITYSLSRTGLTGIDGTSGDSVDAIYKRSATKPTTPTSSTTTPTGWVTNVSDATGTDLLWSSIGNKVGGSATWVWQSPIQVEGVAGTAVAEISIYRRSGSALSTPTGGSYSFDTLTLTPPSGWYVGIPTGTDPVYTSRAIASVQGSSGTDSTLTWTTPVIVFQTGATGTTGASYRAAYARIANNPTPVSGTVTTTGSTTFPDTATHWGMTGITWAATDPNTASTNTLYITDGIYSPTTNNTVWSTPYQVSLKVGSLSAISANLGTVNTGLMKNTNFDTTGGIKVDLDNSQITVGDTVDGDYFNANSGDIQFYRYIGGAHRATKSIKRVEAGIANSGVTTTLPGYWKNPPFIMVSPYEAQLYNGGYPNQSQSLQCLATNISETSSGSGIYTFYPKTQLILSSGSYSQNVNYSVNFTQPGYTVTDRNPATQNTGSITTPLNSTTLIINGSYYAQWRFSGMNVGMRIQIYAIIDGVSYLIIDRSSTQWSWNVDFGVSWPIAGDTLQGTFSHMINSLSTAVHTVYLRKVTSFINLQNTTTYSTSPYLNSPYNNSATFTSYSTNLSGATVLSTGKMNYLAIGE